MPTVALHCIPAEKFRTIDAKAQPTFPGSSCVLGTISVWLNDVKIPRDLYDDDRFEEDPLFARYVADLNVLTYLIGHRDSHEGNMLLSTDPNDPRAYSVDNGIAFDLLPWNLRVFNWFKIRVPWLRREKIDRLRGVTRAQVRALAVVGEMEADAAGIYHVARSGPSFDPKNDQGVRRLGKRIQFGLDEDEIDDLEERIHKLLRNVDSGRQRVR